MQYAKLEAYGCHADGTGNWLEGQRFRSSASEAGIQTWLDSLEL